MAEFDDAHEGERERWRSDPMTQRFLDRLRAEVKNGEEAIADKFTKTGEPVDLQALKFLGGQVSGIQAAITIARRK